MAENWVNQNNPIRTIHFSLIDTIDKYYFLMIYLLLLCQLVLHFRTYVISLMSIMHISLFFFPFFDVLKYSLVLLLFIALPEGIA